MPCRSDYMNANSFEIQGSQAACLLDELDGKPQIDANHWRGYHPKVYCKFATQEIADNLVATLCEKLKGKDLSKNTLEMQTWYRDHVLLDKKNADDDEKTFATFKTAMLKEVAAFGMAIPNTVGIDLTNGNIDVKFHWENNHAGAKWGKVLRHRLPVVSASDSLIGVERLAKRITNDLMQRKHKSDLSDRRIQAVAAVKAKMTDEEKRLVKVVPND